MDEYMRANRALWNEYTSIHEKSAFYNLEGFKAGKITLDPIELEELGDVSGRTLLHLQCHFGLDSLSWARLGAKVTGVDFSDKAIALARSLSKELAIPANFVCSDIYDLPKALKGKFDIVFTSAGVLAWLPDLRRWAQTIVHFLKSGGIFYIHEFHPFAYVFDDQDGVSDLRVAYPYFGSSEPIRCPVKGSYADRGAHVSQPVSYEWAHNLGEIIDSLVAVGLRIDFLHEFPFCSIQMLLFMERGEDGRWRLKWQKNSIPLMFSLKATK